MSSPASPSPFARILRTNTVPTSVECDEIRSYLDPLRRRLGDLDAEVCRLQRLLDAASKARDELQEDISAHEALLSLMRRIPSDVLCLIFMHTLPERRNTAFDETEGPLLLMQVCRYWRDLVLDMPRLWAAIHIIIPRAAVPKEQLTKRLAVWLERSRVVPLSVTMQSTRHAQRPPPMEDPNHGPPSPLSLLLSEANRWRRVRLALDLPDETTQLSGLVQEDVPLLSTFELNLTAPAERGNHTFGFLSTPSLRRLSFGGGYDAFPRTIQWQNIVALQFHLFHDETPSVFPYPFLAECVALEKLSLTVSGEDISVAEGTVQLKRLTRLTFALFGDAAGTSSASVFLHKLELPALHTLDIPFVPPSSAIFQTSTYSNVECLVVGVTTLTADELASILGLLPRLGRLRLNGEPRVPTQDHMDVYDGEFLRKLVLDAEASAATPPLCPSLDHLELVNVQALTDDLILSFLRSRTRPSIARYQAVGVTPLTDFKSYCYREQQLDVCAELAGPISQGLLNVCLIYDPPAPKLKFSPLEATERESRAPILSVNNRPAAVQLHPWLQEFMPDRFLHG
uniref:F-box domain-containing protein n=1 Tax=Mycena chlorophos TaxID=658473 RepID=A0ABQ0M067_MYCCL|nr:predicted protein [Mycena chlorophos]